MLGMGDMKIPPRVLKIVSEPRFHREVFKCVSEPRLRQGSDSNVYTIRLDYHIPIPSIRLIHFLPSLTRNDCIMTVQPIPNGEGNGTDTALHQGRTYKYGRYLILRNKSSWMCVKVKFCFRRLVKRHHRRAGQCHATIALWRHNYDHAREWYTYSTWCSVTHPEMVELLNGLPPNETLLCDCKLFEMWFFVRQQCARCPVERNVCIAEVGETIYHSRLASLSKYITVFPYQNQLAY